MRKRRLFAMTMATAMLTASLAGYSSFVYAASESSAGDGAADGNTITISMRNETGKTEGWQAVADAYTELHPDVKVVVDLKASDNYDQWIQNAFTTSDIAADLVEINFAGTTKTDKAINFADYIDNDSPYSDGTWRDQFDASKQHVETATGQMDSLSLESIQVLWTYNADIFKEVGVEPPKTWDELADICEKIQAAGYQPIAMDGDYNSFYANTMGWLSQVYADQTTRDIVNVTRAQEGDWCYDPDIDGVWTYDLTDPWNDDSDKVSQNAARAFKAIQDGTYAADSQGMKTVWSNFAKVLPEYAGGDAFFGTNKDGEKALFYQGKAAMMVNIAGAIVEFNNDMKAAASGEKIEDSEGNVIDDVSSFELGTFNMPSMEGEGIVADARTIEVCYGSVGAISKSQEHDDLVTDFLMYYSSQEGMSKYLDAAIAAGAVPQGPSLVYDVTYSDDIQAAFDGLTMIGNVQKDFCATIARGVGESAETFRNFYEYSYEYLTGKIDIDTWAATHKENVENNFASALEAKGLGENDLENPQNEPTGN